jgi:hypothetical protein
MNVAGPDEIATGRNVLTLILDHQLGGKLPELRMGATSSLHFSRRGSQCGLR